MRIYEVYDAELDFVVTEITPPTAHEAYATIHLTGGECNAQTCMHMQVIHRFYRNLDGLPLDPPHLPQKVKLMFGLRGLDAVETDCCLGKGFQKRC